MSLSKEQSRIIDLARRIWADRHQYDIDMVDGTFYWRGCRWRLLSRLLDEADRHPEEGLGRLDVVVPGYATGQGTRLIDQYHIPMRAPQITIGTKIARQPRTERAVIWCHVRNKSWAGADVADAIHRAWSDYRGFDSSFEERHREGLGRPEHLVMDMQFSSVGREYRVIDVSEVEGFEFEPGEPTVMIGRKPTPDWEYEPKIEVEVPAPPPAKQVIASWFDAVAIDTYGWTDKLRGATDGQRKDIAIRTWAIALLIAAGRTQDFAFSDVEGIIRPKNCPTLAVYYENRESLLRRVPEARPFLDVRGGRRIAPDVPSGGTGQH